MMILGKPGRGVFLLKKDAKSVRVHKKKKEHQLTLNPNDYFGNQDLSRMEERKEGRIEEENLPQF
jgi:ribosomal protein L24E